MSPLKHGTERKFFDVHATPKRRHVLNLRPKFRIRHPLITVIVLLAGLTLLFFGIREISTRADVQDFVPTTCLGSWQNVANAEGNPETLTAANPAFSSANSAIYASGTEIYCGGFIPPSFATSGQITNVGLTLVWQIGEAPTSTPAPTPTSTPDATASSSADGTSATTTVPASTTLSATTTVATSTNIVPSSSVATTSASTSVEASTTAPADSTDSSTDDGASDVPAPAASSTPTPAPASSTSFLRQLIPFAFADGAAVSSTTSSTSASTSTLAPANATTAVALPPPAPDENFLDVSYSTDGQTWISVGQVNINNWQDFTVTLPIADWTDLQNLQIRVEGIPTTQDPVPPVYLDGMFVEVHYDTATSLDPADTASSTIEATSSAPSSSPSARMTLVDPGAAQDCTMDPFSEDLPPGGTAAFTVDLHPSINGVSYNLLLGHLPRGVSAVFGTPSGPIAATSSLVFQAETSTPLGSMNVAVIYQEQEENGATLSNFCQLNIDVR